MTRVIRSRRAPRSRDLPLYARVLGLRHLAPSGLLCFVFLEGTIALGVLLALAELVSWWGVLVLPATVAMMVKLNDVIAGIVAVPAATPARRSARAVSGGTAPASRRAPIRPAAGSSGALARDDRSPSRARAVDPSDHLGAGQARSVDLRERGSDQVRMSGAWGDVAAETAVAARESRYGTPVSRQGADQFDVRQQIARQSAARHYE
jgi:hypothetical protein